MVNSTSKRLKANLKLRLVLFFLVLSSIFWLLINLSKTYVDTITVELSYSGLPENKVFQTVPISEVEASIKTSGFNLLTHRLVKKKVNLSIQDFRFKGGNEYYFLPNRHASAFSSKFNVTIDRIQLDTIYVYLGLTSSKKVPIVLDKEIEYALGYNVVGDYVITPDSVMIKGPDSQIDTIDLVRTQQLLLKEVSSDIHANIGLELFGDDSKIELSTQECSLIAKVDKFTEGALKVPFKVINIPEGYEMTTFPNEVEITYLVGLSNFNKITIDSFEIICDFELSQTNNLSYLIPQLQSNPPLVSNIKIKPDNIEFLIAE